MALNQRRIALPPVDCDDGGLLGAPHSALFACVLLPPVSGWAVGLPTGFGACARHCARKADSHHLKQWFEVFRPCCRLCRLRPAWHGASPCRGLCDARWSSGPRACCRAPPPCKAAPALPLVLRNGGLHLRQRGKRPPGGSVSMAAATSPNGVCPSIRCLYSNPAIELIAGCGAGAALRCECECQVQ